MQTDRTLDPEMVDRALGALSGIWASQGKAHTVEEWAATVKNVKAEVRDFVLRLSKAE